MPPKQFPDIPDPAALLPPPAALRERLAHALREVDILRRLLRLAEGVAARDGRSVALPSDPDASRTPVTA